MDWKDKIKILDEKSKDKDDDRFFDVYVIKPMWQKKELESIVLEYAWLPKSYLDYIKDYDSSSITFCNFYGSRLAKGMVLQDQMTYNQQYLKKDYFAFASDADGSRFIFNKKGQVLYWSIDDYDFEEEPKLLAETFEEFVDECLLGKRYEEFSNIENDDMWNFYKEQGWV